MQEIHSLNVFDLKDIWKDWINVLLHRVILRRDNSLHGAVCKKSSAGSDFKWKNIQNRADALLCYSVEHVNSEGGQILQSINMSPASMARLTNK